MNEVLTYEALKADRDAQQKRADALAVENAAVKAMNDCLSEELRGYESDGAFEGPNMHLLWWKSETPATSDALAAIEVRGVERAAEYTTHESFRAEFINPDVSLAFAGLADDLRKLAIELREAK